MNYYFASEKLQTAPYTLLIKWKPIFCQQYQCMHEGSSCPTLMVSPAQSGQSSHTSRAVASPGQNSAYTDVNDRMPRYLFSKLGKLRH